MTKRTNNDDFYPDDFIIDDTNIDEGFKALLDPLPTKVLKQLEQDIAKDGCREPLTMWVEKGLLVDGHNRYEICTRRGKLYRVKKKSFKSRAEAEVWIVKNQRNRRNTNKFQLAMSALKCRKSIEKIAKEAQSKGGGSVKQKSANPVNTLDTMARMAGISRPTLQQIEFILKHADQQTIDKLRQGDTGLSINSVYVSLREAKDDKKATGNTRSRTKPTRKASSKEVEVKVDTTISSLDGVEQQLSQKDDRMYFCDKIIEWAKARKQAKNKGNVAGTTKKG